MTLTRTLLLPVLALSLIQALGCSSDDDTAQSSLVWSACETVETMECSTLDVPLDYDDPDGETLGLALTRQRASGTDRQGSLVFNPGGPGASGVAMLGHLAGSDAIPMSIQSAFDLVSFDPRGVGASMPVDCADEGLDAINGYPIGDAAIAELHAQYTRFADNCFAKHGAYLQQLGSMNGARDMDRIRVALGEEELNFIGYSYGTRLAALYLQEFPEHSGRIVLDASGDPDPSVRTLALGQLPQRQANLESTLSLCVMTDPECDPGALLNTLVSRINLLFASARSDAETMELGLLLGIVGAVAEDPEFGAFAADALIQYLYTLDVSVLQQFVQQAWGMDDDEDAPGSNQAASIAVLCADDAFRPDVETLVAASAEFNQISDLFAELILSQLAMCTGWPAAVDPLSPIMTDRAPLSLVIGGSSDAQAPLAASEDMASRIGGIFIRSDHDGHTAVFNEQSDCVDALVESFLLDGLAPTVQVCN